MARDAKLNAYIEMRAEQKGLVSAVKSTQKEIDTLSKRFANLRRRQSAVNRTMQRFGRGLLTQVTSMLAFGAALQQAAAAALEFDTNMAKVQFLVGIAADDVKKLADGVREISMVTGRSVTELSDGLFDVQSAGFRGAQSLEVLKRAADAAVLGLGTTKTMADAMTNALGAWGTANLTAADTVAILWAGVREGKAPAEAFATLVSDVGALSAQLGIELDQVVGAFAHLTRSMDEATARTRIKGILNAFLKPSEQMVNTMRQYGLSVKDVAQAIERDLLGALNMVRRTVDDDQLGKFFRNTEGLAGFLSLTGGNYDAARQVTAGVSGTTVSDFDTQVAGAQGTIRNSWNRAIAPLTTEMVKLAENVLPPVINAFGILTGTAGRLIGSFNWLIDWMRDQGEGTTDTRTGRGRHGKFLNQVGKPPPLVGGRIESLGEERARSIGDTARWAQFLSGLGNVGGRIETMGHRLYDLTETQQQAAVNTQRAMWATMTRGRTGYAEAMHANSGIFDSRRHQQDLLRSQAAGVFAGGEQAQNLIHALQERVGLRQREAEIAKGLLDTDHRANAVAQARAKIDQSIADIRADIRKAEFDLSQATTDDQRRAAELTLTNLNGQLEAIQAINLEAPEYRALFDEYARWSQEIDAAADAQRELQAQITRTQNLVEFGKNAAVDMFLAFTEGTMSAKDAMKTFARDVIRELYRVIVVQQTVNALAGALGFGGGFSTAAPAPAHRGSVYAIPGRAYGGNMLAGQPYWVGEHGRELVVPETNSRAESDIGAGGVTVNNTFNIQSTDGPGVRKAIAEATPEIVEASKNFTVSELSNHTADRRSLFGG